MRRSIATAAPASGSASTAVAEVPTAPLRYGTGLPIRRASVRSVSGPCADAFEAARRQIMAHCTNPGFANGAIHGVRALGRELPLGDGDPHRLLLENYLRETWLEEQMLLEVPVHHEGHRHAMLKTLVEQECDLDLEFRIGERTYRFRDYVESARLLHTYDLSVLPIDEQSWTIMAFTRVTPPDAARWRNIHGSVVDLGQMIDDTSAALARDTHLAAALSSGYDTPRRREAFAEHMRTHLRRFRYDLVIIDEVETLNMHRVGPERAGIRALSGRLKFLGHTFEVIGLVDQFSLYEFTREERQVVDAARQRLCEILSESRSLDLQRYRSAKEFYEGLVGDICHAYNGLRTSLA
jgi:hypothetical protein